MPELYLVDREEDPGIIFMLEEGRLRPVYFRSEGLLDAIAVFESGPAYFVAPGHTDIYSADGLTETLVYRHDTFVRNVCFHPDSGNHLYFSESWGAGRDGRVLRLNLGLGRVDIFCTVPVGEVGYWAGDFAFDPDGNLYISSGNHRPAAIYGYVGGHFSEQYTSDDCIMGFCFVDADTLCYTDFDNHLYRLTGFADRVVEYEARPDARLTDVAYVELPEGALCRIEGHLYGGEHYWPITTIRARGPDLYWRLLEHAHTHPDDRGDYELENLLPGDYWVYTEIHTEGWATFLPSYHAVSCGNTDVDFTMSQEGLSLDLLGLQCNDAQELTDEVYIVVDGERIWASSLRTGNHRPIGHTFTFHEEHRIEVWEADPWRDDLMGVLVLSYEDAVALLRGDEGPYIHTFHRDRGIVGDATYTLHFDIS
jgi:hypothetical protein